MFAYLAPRIAVAVTFALLTVALVGLATRGDSPSSQEAGPLWVTSQHGAGMVVHGCIAEDGCRANFRANGTWIIRPVTP